MRTVHSSISDQNSASPTSSKSASLSLPEATSNLQVESFSSRTTFARKLLDGGMAKAAAIFLAGSGVIALASSNRGASSNQDGQSARASIDQDNQPVDSSPNNKQEPNKSSELVREILISDTNKDSSRVVIDTYELGSFKYNGIQRPIVVSKSIMTQNPNGIQNGVGLKGKTLFLNPDISINKADLNEAFDKKIPVESIGSVPQYKIRFMLDILSDEYRLAAVNFLKKMYPDADISIENVSLVPYQYIEFYIMSADKKIIIDSYPKVTTATKFLPELGNLDVQFPMEFTGSEEELRNFVDNIEIHADFYRTGFTVKQNLLSYSTREFVDSGLHHFLNGKANFELLAKQRSGSSGGGFSLGGIIGLAKQNSEGTHSVSQTSIVTRNQIKEVIQHHISNIDIGMFSEIHDKTKALEQVRELLINKIYERSSSIEIQVSEQGKLIFDDEQLKKELGPDIIGKIESELHSKPKIKASDKVEYTQGKDKISSDKKFEYVGDEDIKYVEDSSGRVIPKSIDLVQINNSVFDDFAAANIADTYAEKNLGFFTVTSSTYHKAVIDVVNEQKVKIHQVLPKFFPPHTGGDRNYWGHGPEITLIAQLRLKDNEDGGQKIVLDLYSKFIETDPDGTAAAGGQEIVVYSAPKGTKIIGFDGPELGTIVHYTETEHRPTTIETPIGAVTFYGHRHHDSVGGYTGYEGFLDFELNVKLK